MEINLLFLKKEVNNHDSFKIPLNSILCRYSENFSKDIDLSLYPLIKKEDVLKHKAVIEETISLAKKNNTNLIHADSINDALFFLKVKQELDLPLIVSIKESEITEIKKIGKMIIHLSRFTDLFIVKSIKAKKILLKLGCSKENIVVLDLQTNNQEYLLHNYGAVLIKHNKDFNPEVILVNCPCASVEYPSLGLSYIYSFLKCNNVPTLCYDINKGFNSIIKKELSPKVYERIVLDEDNITELIPKELYKETLDFWSKKIIAQNPSVLAFSVRRSNRDFSIHLAEKIKSENSSIKIVFGGPETTDDSSIENIEPVDYIIQGEGKKAYDKLYKIIKKNLKDKLFYPEFPDYSWANISAYFNINNELKNYPIISGTGCNQKCKFCNDKKYEPLFTLREPENVVSEMRYLHDNYGISRFFFINPLINGKLSWLIEFCNKLIHSKIKINWGASLAPQILPAKALLEKMAESGCKFFVSGIESGSEKVRADMGKIVDTKNMEDTLRIAKELGIHRHLFFIVGYPTETEKDFEKTLDFFKRNKEYIGSVKIGGGYKFQIGSVSYDEMYDNPDCHIDKSVVWDSLWTYKDNTPEVRLKRLRKFKQLVNDAGVLIIGCNEDYLLGKSLPKKISD